MASAKRTGSDGGTGAGRVGHPELDREGNLWRVLKNQVRKYNRRDSGVPGEGGENDSNALQETGGRVVLWKLDL